MKPQAITDIKGPYLEVTRVPGQPTAVDVHVTHQFRAHFNPQTLDPRVRNALTQEGSFGGAPPPAPASPHVTFPTAGPLIVEVSGDEAAALGHTPHPANHVHVARGDSDEISPHELLHHGSGVGASAFAAVAAAVAATEAELEDAHPLSAIVHPARVSSSAGTDVSQQSFTRALSSIPGEDFSEAPPSRGNPDALAVVAPEPGVLAGAAAARPLARWQVNPSEVHVGHRLAVGGYAEVFLGKYQGTIIAVKLLLDVDVGIKERFLREVAVLASLRHPNLLLFMGFTMEPRLAILTEYMSRGSLFKVLRRGGNVPLEERLLRAVAVSVARGMVYLHTRSPPLLHLDLKSPNILIDERWRIKIGDFGLTAVRMRTFVSGAGAGTPEWMAPEVLKNEGVDEKADVYSYGVVLWECLTGQAPWEGLHPMQVVAAVGFQGRKLRLPTDTDPFLTDLCGRCMSQSPADRPSFTQILAELEREYAPPRFHSMHSTLSESDTLLSSLASREGSSEAEGAKMLPAPEAPPPQVVRDRVVGLPPKLPSSPGLVSPFAALGARTESTKESQAAGNNLEDDGDLRIEMKGMPARHGVDMPAPPKSLDTPFAHVPPFDADDDSASEPDDKGEKESRNPEGGDLATGAGSQQALKQPAAVEHVCEEEGADQMQEPALAPASQPSSRDVVSIRSVPSGPHEGSDEGHVPQTHATTRRASASLEHGLASAFQLAQL